MQPVRLNETEQETKTTVSLVPISLSNLYSNETKKRKNDKRDRELPCREKVVTEESIVANNGCN